MYKDLYPKRWQWHFVYALIFSIHRTSQKQIYLGILMWNKAIDTIGWQTAQINIVHYVKQSSNSFCVFDWTKNRKVFIRDHRPYILE